MPTTSGISINTDTQLAVIRSQGQLPLIGTDSEFVTTAHPATGNKIQGWKWDERVWASELELNNVEFAPSIWDPTVDGLLPSDFQSGIGDNNDLKVTEVRRLYPSGTATWSPIVYHGYYYDQDQENYLFSDDSVIDIVPSGQTTAGLNYMTLSFEPKPGIPIIGARYEWDNLNGQYKYDVILRKKGKFTGSKNLDGSRKDTLNENGDLVHANVDTTKDELWVDYENSPPTIWLSDNYIEEHGVAPASGVLDNMEQLGTSTGQNNEEFHTLYSPVASGIHIVSYTGNTFLTWTVVDSINNPGECEFDYDLGIVRFGEGAGYHPVAGESVAAHYSSSIAVEYEKKLGRNTVEAIEADLNPMGRSASSGFIYVKRKIIDPASIVLEADTTLISSNFYGPVYLGSFVNLIATVRSSSGDVVDGEEVTFTIGNGFGGFSGGEDEISALTNFNGEATTIFSAPRNIRNIGGIGEYVVINSPNAGETTIVLSGVNLSGDPTSWYIYKTYTDDPILGVDSAKEYYISYFAEEGITGPTADDLNDDGSGWENTHRLLVGLLTPAVYGAAFRNGKKQLLVTYDTSAIHPHTFQPGAFIPVRPTSYSLNGDGGIEVVVSGVLDVPGAAVSSGINNRLAGYFIAGPTIATVQASVYNERLGATILSNEITLDMRIPPSMDGTPLIETLNEVESSGIFGNMIGPPTSGVLPLGFRFRSTGVSLAGVLDGLTYIDVNRQSDVLMHAFTVTDSGVSI